MSAKIKGTNEPIKAKVIWDFVPTPAELVFGEGVKVTLALSKKSIELFKAEAAKHHTQYQHMIRKVHRHENTPSLTSTSARSERNREFRKGA